MESQFLVIAFPSEETRENVSSTNMTEPFLSTLAPMRQLPVLPLSPLLVYPSSLLVVLYFIWRHFFFRCATQKDDPPAVIQAAGPRGNAVQQSLRDLVADWPPTTHSHQSWPLKLHGYHQVWEATQPHLTTATSELDSTINRATIEGFRERMILALKENIDLEGVNYTLDHDIPPFTWNGFTACIAFLRHAFR